MTLTSSTNSEPNGASPFLPDRHSMRPRGLVVLGATAGKALFGSKFRPRAVLTEAIDRI
jgi:hypothetical protein